MVRNISHGKSQQGMTYVFFLWFILIYGILLGSYIEVISTQAKRLKEQDFIYTAELYVKALENYYKDKQTLPIDIKQLLCDGPAYPCKRYLRQLYKDPLTQQSFVYTYDEQHQITGVKTLAKGKIMNNKIREIYKAKNYNNLNFTVTLINVQS